MATVPQDLLDLLNEAQKQLDEANEAAVYSQLKSKEVEDVIEEADEAKEVAFEQLQESNAAAAFFLAEFKRHFGVE